MANLYLWSSFSKRDNSTLRPSTTADATVSIDLLTIEDLKRPRFLLSASYLTNNYTYALFEGRYYFLSEPTIVNGDMIAFEGTFDYLATFKEYIGATTAYIQYATSGYLTKLTDDRISATNTLYVKNSSYAETYNFTSLTHCFTDHKCYATFIVVGDNEKANIGGVSGYQLDPGEMQVLFDAFISNVDGLDSQIEVFQKNPYDAICKVMYYPARLIYDTSNYERTSSPQTSSYTKSTVRIAGQSMYVVVGGDTQYINGYPLMLHTFATVDSVGETTLPLGGKKWWDIVIPQAHNGDFRDYPPFAKYELFLPFIGYVDFEIKNYINDTQVRVDCFLDAIGGQIHYMVTGNNSGNKDYYSADVGIEVPISQVKKNTVQGMMETTASAGALGLGIGLHSPTAVFGGVTGVIKGVIDATRYSINHTGGIGNFGKVYDILKLSSTDKHRMAFMNEYYYGTSPDPTNADFIATNGRLVNSVGTISSYSGYIKCVNASVSLAASDDEINTINNYLNGGFFYE